MSEARFIDLSAFDGLWNASAQELDDASRLKAIKLAMDNLSWVVRKMASGVLRRSTAPPQELRFVWDGNRLHQHLGDPDRGLRTRTIELDRPLADSAENAGGESTDVVWLWTDAGLELHWAQSRAHGRNLYRVDPSGQSLVVEQQIQVTALDGFEPIVFETRFGLFEPSSMAAAGGSSAREIIR